MGKPDSTVQERFGTLLREHRRIVYHVARMYAATDEDRHDLAQEICAQLWRAFPSYDSSRPFATWMYRIALNTGISHVRRERERLRHLQPLDETVAETTAAPVDAASDERLRELDALIARLDPLNRALVMLYLEDRSYAEIADILGITETNVATKIGRIKQRLREQVAGGTHSPEKKHGTR